MQLYSIGLAATYLAVATAANNTTWPKQTFKTANFTPPVLDISHSDERHVNTTGPSPEYLFFAPDGTPAMNPDSAPMIADADGETIWNGAPQHAFGFSVHTYKGEKVLASWNGTSFREPVGRGNGVVYLWDKHYEHIAVVSLPGNFLELNPGATYPSNIDLHEIYITSNDTMLVTANNVTQMDLTSVGGPKDGWIVEAQVYEIDISTNEMLFSWKSLDHLDEIPLTASLYPLGSEGFDGSSQTQAWGYFHINAVSPYQGGGYILSARYLCSAIALSPSGSILWRLQGRDGNGFTLHNGTNFCYQHDIRVVDHDSSHNCLTIQLHDNHNCPIDNGTTPTSGKVLNVNLSTKQVTLQKEYINPLVPIYANAQGSFQRLPNSNVVLGHGWVPVIEEFSSSGQILSTTQFGYTPRHSGGGFDSSPTTAVTLSYRAYKYPWIGCPKTQPAVVANYIGSPTNPRGTAVYISWNGATEVEGWDIYGGIETLSYITTVPKKGFETVANISDVEFVQVRPILSAQAPPRCGQNVTSDLVFISTA